MQSTASTKVPVFLLGISGPSSSGKTTLAHQLSNVFGPHVRLILHGDDFCKDISLLPVRNGYVDADGPDGVDFESLVKVLDYVKVNEGKAPDNLKSWQKDAYPDQEAQSLSMISAATLNMLKHKASEQLHDADNVYIVVIEGFLLYHTANIRERLDGKLFLTLHHAEAKRRRLTRPSYGPEAKEGEFWKTEDYFEKMVWRNYVEQHADLFEGGNVEGDIDSNLCNARGISVQTETNSGGEQTLIWAVDTLISLLKMHTTHLRKPR